MFVRLHLYKYAVISAQMSGMGEEKVASEAVPKRPNSTSSMYISSTMSVPDNDEIMLSVGTVIKCILSKHASDKVPPIDADKELCLFDERYHQDGRSETKLSDELTTAEDVFHFLKSVFEMAQFSPECNTISLVLINRFLNKSKMVLHEFNWRALLLCALLIAQKIWDDRCLTNVDFPVIWRNAVTGVRENTFAKNDKQARDYISRARQV